MRSDNTLTIFAPMNTQNDTARPMRPQDIAEVTQMLAIGQSVWYKPFMRSYDIIPSHDRTEFDVVDTDGFFSHNNSIEQVIKFVEGYDAGALNDFE